MTLPDLLKQLRSRDIRVWAEDDRLRISAPKGALGADLQRELARLKPELLEWLRATSGSGGGSPLTRVSRDATLPLSYGQSRLWFLHEMDPAGGAYHIAVNLPLRRVDVQALADSLADLVARHEILRSTIVVEQGEPRQQIHPPAPVRLEEHDLRWLPREERAAELQRLVQAVTFAPFDLARGPLLRCALIWIDGEDSELVIAQHHVITDGWSLALLLGELTALYGARVQGRPSPLPEPVLQYGDYAAWQQEWLKSPALERELVYWRRTLQGLVPLELPTDRPRPPIQTFKGATQTFELTPALSSAIKVLSRDAGATVNMTLMAGFGVFLHHWCGQTDVAIGMSNGNRPQVELETMLGFFVNTQVLRVDLGGGPSFREVIGRVSSAALEAHAHQGVPFGRLVEELRPERDLSRSPLCDVLFILQNTPLETEIRERASDQSGAVGLPLRERAGQVAIAPTRELSSGGSPRRLVETGTSKLDLTLYVEESPDGYRGTFEYNTDLFDHDTITRALDRFEAMLEAAVRQPDLAIADLPRQTAAEQTLLAGWNSTGRAISSSAWHELVIAQASRTPDRLAVSADAVRLTYRELVDRSGALAGALQASGLGRGDIAGLFIERSADMVVAMLAIARSGAAYLPLDPGFPPDRLAYMASDADVRLIVAEAALESTAQQFGAPVITVSHALGMARQPSKVGTSPNDLAYVIYTSGSTGRPKGVEVPHGALTNFLESMRDEPGLTPDDTLVAVTTLSFDIAALELLLPLVCGATVVVANRAAVIDPVALRALLTASGARVMQATPVTWRMLLDSGWMPPDRFRALCGGEALPSDLADRLLHAGVELWNLYGPTETTIWSTVDRVRTAQGRIAIGRPIANTQVHILDASGHDVAPGAIGEIWIGGAGVARGYHNRPDLTAERFVPAADGSGGRWYRTGDRGRWRADGRLECLGRIDHQVKVRGFRIELGEIESVLAAQPGVAQAVVHVQGEGTTARLVAYLVAGEGSQVDEAALREAAAAALPLYMQPSAYLTLDRLPLTANGKVDRKALPPIDGSPAGTSTFVAPRDGMESLIAGVWRDVLGCDAVSVRANFFDLGGHSLLLVQVQAKLAAALQRSIAVVELFQYPTIDALARHLGGREAATSARAAADARQAMRTGHPHDAIAIIGMAGRFPGAPDVETFWQNLRQGVESLRRFSDEELLASGIPPERLADPRHVPVRGVIDGADLFDAQYFGYAPREAEMLDPQQRVFLECASEALDRAGYDSLSYTGPIGVYAGSSLNAYVGHLLSNRDIAASLGGVQLLLAGDKDHLPTRVSYKLGLRGPSVNVQTACSTSLVAVHQACRSLLDYECDMALAGGVSIGVPLIGGYRFVEGGILSPDGHCRAFDAAAQGTVPGSGCGVVVLKRLDDALRDGDVIHAVIRGSAVNNDGADKVGYTAPSVRGQVEALALAYATAQVDPASVGYIEAHGTGTALGDPIEMRALTTVFREHSSATGFCAIGSLKTNVGHMDAAAGVGGLMKAVLAVRHGERPPSLHFDRPNPEIDFAGSPFTVNATLSPWPSDSTGPRRAGVSSFGIGGTNAHVVIEEAPVREASSSARLWQVLTLSARTPTALARMASRLASHLASNPDCVLADVAHTLQVGRRPFEHRRTVVASSLSGAIAALERGDEASTTRVRGSEPNVVLMFSGQGTQYAGMGRELYESEPVYREAVDRCAGIVDPLTGGDLRRVLLATGDALDAAASSLESTLVTQLALFVTEYALAQVWMAWGIKPIGLIGHSIGEYVAACVSGAVTLDDALRLVVVRGRLMDQAPSGAMIAIARDEQTVAGWLEDAELWLAAVNGPSQCVVAGTSDAIERLSARLNEAGVDAQRLRTSGAFHSGLMDHVVAPLTEAARRVRTSPPRIPWVSNVTGAWITEAQIADAGYWGEHLRQPVRFADGIRQLMAAGATVFLELGPGNTLGALVRRSADTGTPVSIVPSMRHALEEASDAEQLALAVARAWRAGIAIDWAAYRGTERRRRVDLPPYPFERQRYWVEADRSTRLAPAPASIAKRDDLSRWFFVPAWRHEPLADPPRDAGETWLVFVDEEGLGRVIASRAAARGHRVITVLTGRAFTERASGVFEIDPASTRDHDLLVDRLKTVDAMPRRVVHGWTLEPLGATTAGDAARAEQRGFHSLRRLVQALGRRAPASPVDLLVAGSHMEWAGDGDAVVAERALALGLCLVVPQEYSAMRCSSIDVLTRDDEIDAAADMVIAEAAHGPDGRAVAIRNGRRLVRSYQQLSLPAGPSPVSKPGGAYLITGGTGRIGLAIASHFARQNPVKLALVGRTAALNDEQRAAIAAIEALGSDVVVLAGDVADPSQLQNVIATTRRRLGELRGVVHAAGVQRLAPLAALDEPACDAVFRAKVHGSRMLARALAGIPLDFVALTSSLSSVLGGMGMGAYASANRFLDGLADEQRSGKTRWISIDMDAWAFGEATVATSVTELAMTVAEGVDAVGRVLDQALDRRVVISTADLDARLDRYVRRTSPRDTAGSEVSPAARYERPNLDTDYSVPIDAMEKTVADVWQALLGIERVGRHDSFFELGGHSLLLVQMHEILTARSGREVAVTDLFKYPTVAQLAEHLAGTAAAAPAEAAVRDVARTPGATPGVAIIGLAGRFPGAPDIEAFWRSLRDGVEGISALTDDELRAQGVPDEWLRRPDYVKVANGLAAPDDFDAAFFGYTPREAELMDPQHRVFLECAWEALERAGCDPATYPGPIGVYAGAGQNGHALKVAGHPDLARAMGSLQTSVATATDHLPSRVSYKLNLRGPSVNVQTACSTSLVAVHQACRSLLDGECDVALAGGVSVRPSALRGYLYQEDGILSPDGHCRAFDARAQGTVWGDGVGVVVLKRLDDALADGDAIHAVIRGSAVNNDGAVKVGYTAPGIDGQAAVVTRALAVAGVTPKEIGYVEAHGTGTALGDPVEIAALSQVFGAGDGATVPIGTVKSNVGHLDAASGVAGLIKTVLALEHGAIPPHLHFEAPNPKIDFARSPFFVNARLRPWPRSERVRIAGVSSFGLGGTNAHVVVEEAPDVPDVGSPARDWQLLVLSARTGTALAAASDRLITYLEEHQEVRLADVAHTLQVGRSAMPYRRAVACRNAAEGASALGERGGRPVTAVDGRPPSCVFMFSGQGSQYAGMAAGLYRDEPAFRADVDACCGYVRPHLPRDLREVLFPVEEDRAASALLTQTAYAQPALFAIEYALARLWMRWGVSPSALIGHSIGEYVAATLAGVFTLEDGVKVVAARGRLMQELPPGAMLAVSMSESGVLPLLEPGLELAAINAPGLVVVSGSTAAIDAFDSRLQARGIISQRLQTSHAFHSAMMEPALQPFHRIVSSVRRQRPSIPFVSNLTGDWIADEQAVSADYWCEHLRRPVRFADAVAAVLRRSPVALIEVGPGRTLATLARQTMSPAREDVVVTSLRHPRDGEPDRAVMLRSVGSLWTAGVGIAWPEMSAGERRRRVPLPTYPFERQRFALGPVSVPAAAARAARARQNLDDWFSVVSWKRASGVRQSNTVAPNASRRWLLFADASGVAARVGAHLIAAGADVVMVEPGAAFERVGDGRYRLDRNAAGDYRRLMEGLASANRVPDVIGHFWAVDAPGDLVGATTGEQVQRGFYSLLFLTQALEASGSTRPLRLAVAATDVLEVTGEEVVCPAKATLFGPCRVIPSEYPHVTTRVVDLVCTEWQDADETRLNSLVDALASDRPEMLVAFRHGYQWVPRVEPAPLMAAEPGNPALRSGGVYLVTGGYGGIGLSLARHLARTTRARLALVGRTGVPPREQWPQLLASASDADRVSRQIAVLQELEAAGSEVLTLVADVTEEPQMRAAFEAVESRWGSIDGVVHAAGVAGGGVIQLKAPEVAARVLSPKVTGTEVLGRCLEGRTPDFLALCSSTTGLRGGGGQVDYCSANAFLDAFAGEYGRRTGTYTVSIDWDAWREVGMAVETNVPAEVARQRAVMLKDAIGPDEGAEAFARIVASRPGPQVVVSPFAWGHDRVQPTGAPRDEEARVAAAETAIEERGYERPALETAFEAPRNEIEERVAEVWQQMFGMGRLGINDDFFALGGHSLLATQVISRLRAEFQLSLALDDLFVAPTIAGLSDLVLARLIEEEEGEAAGGPQEP
jgi:amino acid adenylation domain-containing protein